MRKIIILVIFNLSALSAFGAEGNLILETASGLSSESLPFSSGWNGSIGPGHLQAREFAFKATYIYNSHLSASSTIGFLKYWYEGGIDFFYQPYWYPSSRGTRETRYFRPTITLSSNRGRFDLGILVYKLNRNKKYVYAADNYYYPLNEVQRVKPVIGMELGDQRLYVYLRFLNSFPLVSGGGVYEFGIAGRSKSIYEHKFYITVSEFQGGAIGYRGEFRVYKKIAITPGFSVGGRDRDKSYMMTLGLKSLIDL